MESRRAARPDPRCPLRPSEPCTLCQVDVTGPEDCGLVYLVMDDPELRAELGQHRLATLGRRQPPGGIAGRRHRFSG